MNKVTALISLIFSTSLYPAAIPSRSCDGANASAAATPAAEVKRSAAEGDIKENDQRPVAALTTGNYFFEDAMPLQERLELVPHLEYAKKLHEAGAIDRVDEEGYTPLQRAAQLGEIGRVKALVSYGADVNVTYQGKALQELATPEVQFHLTGIILGVPTQCDRDVISCIRRVWFLGHHPKPWIQRLMANDDVQTFRKMFCTTRPNIQALIPLLWYGIGHRSIRIIRYILEQLELCGLQQRTKSYILNKVINELSYNPFEKFSATAPQVIQEFRYAGYDPFYYGSCEASGVLGEWLAQRPFGFSLQYAASRAFLMPFAEDYIDHPVVERTAAVAGNRELREEVAQLKHALIQERLQHRIRPQLQLITEALLAVDHPQKNVFTELAPLIQSYAGLPRVSVPLADEQGMGERIKRFGYKMIRSIKERIGHLG